MITHSSSHLMEIDLQIAKRRLQAAAVRRSGRQVALAAGVSQSVLSAFLRGETEPIGNNRLYLLNYAEGLDDTGRLTVQDLDTGRVTAIDEEGNEAAAIIIGQDGPPRVDGAAEARGVRYAAEAMAETLHRLLREAREADERERAAYAAHLAEDREATRARMFENAAAIDAAEKAAAQNPTRSSAEG